MGSQHRCGWILRIEDKTDDQESESFCPMKTPGSWPRGLNRTIGGREVGQQLRVFALAEDPGLILLDHTWLTTAYNCSSGNLMPSLDYQGHYAHVSCAYIHAVKHSYA